MPAIRHYLVAGDVAATVALAEATVDTMLNKNLAESARSLVRRTRRSSSLAHAALAIAAGWVYASVRETRVEERHWRRLMAELDLEDGPSADRSGIAALVWLILIE